MKRVETIMQLRERRTRNEMKNYPSIYTFAKVRSPKKRLRYETYFCIRNEKVSGLSTKMKKECFNRLRKNLKGDGSASCLLL